MILEYEKQLQALSDADFTAEAVNQIVVELERRKHPERRSRHDDTCGLRYSAVFQELLRRHREPGASKEWERLHEVAKKRMKGEGV